MTPDAILNKRAKQIQFTIEHGFFSEDAILCVEGHPELKIRGIHKWGSVSSDLGTDIKRKGEKHWFDLCSLSLPDWAKSKASLKSASMIIEDKNYRVIDIGETFAKYCLTLAPKGDR